MTTAPADPGRRRRRAAATAVAGLLLGACGGPGSTAAGPAGGTEGRSPGPLVTVRQFRFTPGNLAVTAGAAVTWTNQDDILHTATSGSAPGAPDGRFDGPMDGPGTSFSFAFSEPGTYPYFCSRHNSMTGTVVVR